jgi:hypothetical protein
MGEQDKQLGKQPSCNELAKIIVNDFYSYLNTGTVGIELESFIEYHIAKRVETVSEEYIQQVMNRVLHIIRSNNARANGNS